MEKESCANRISTALALRGLKQSDLCLMTGISKATMSQYIQGKYEPSQVRTEIISRALDVSEAWLMGYSVSMDRKKPIANIDDGLWEMICNDETKLMLARWICDLSPEELERVSALLDLAHMLPRE